MGIGAEMLDNWLDGLCDDDDPFSDEDYGGSPLRCKYCGSTDVYWMQVQGHGVKYKLIDNNTGQQHRCNHMDDNEFEDLT